MGANSVSLQLVHTGDGPVTITRWYQKSFRDWDGDVGLLDRCQKHGYTGLYLNEMTEEDFEKLKSLTVETSLRFMIEVPLEMYAKCRSLPSFVEINHRIDWPKASSLLMQPKEFSPGTRLSVHFRTRSSGVEAKRFSAFLESLPSGLLVHLVFPLTHSGLAHQESQIRQLVERMRKMRADLQISGPMGWGIEITPMNEHQRHPTPVLVAEHLVSEVKPEVSVIIPTFDKWGELKVTIANLETQLFRSFEVIVVDTGSPGCNLQNKSDEIFTGARFPWKFIALQNEARHQMGDHNFRAALARNTGAAVARGEWLSFLDDDVIVPPHYLDWVMRHCDDNVTVMGQRWESSRQTSPYWTQFYARSQDWNQLVRPWRFVCTHSLTVKSVLFHQVGGFRECFTSYGFEDGEFAYRLHAKGAKFRLTPFQVFHQTVPRKRLEWSGSSLRRWRLLQTTGALFYRVTLSEEVYGHCRYLFHRPRWMNRVLLAGFERWNRLIAKIRRAAPYSPSEELNYGPRGNSSRVSSEIVSS